MTTPKTIKYYTECNVINYEKSVDLINLAAQQGKLPSRFGHVWSLAKTLVGEPCSLALQIAEFATSVITLALSIPFPKKWSTHYFFFNVIFYHPLLIGCKVMSAISRIGATILGIASPEHAVKVWLWADLLELSVLQKKARFYSDSFSEKTTTEFSIVDITPKTAVWYLGSNVCKEIEHARLGVVPLELLDNEIKDALAERIVAFQTRFPELIPVVLERCRSKGPMERLLYPNFENFSIPDNVDVSTMKSQLEGLTSKDLGFLDKILGTEIASKVLQASFYTLKNNNPEDKAAYEQLKKDLSVRETDLKIAFSYRDGFGCVKQLK